MSEVVKQIRFSSIRSFWLWSNWKKRSKHQLHVHLISQALLPASPASRRIIYPSIHPSTHLAEAVNASVVTMVIRFRWTNGLLGKVLLSASDDLYPRPFSPRCPCMSVSLCVRQSVWLSLCMSVVSVYLYCLSVCPDGLSALSSFRSSKILYMCRSLCVSLCLSLCVCFPLSLSAFVSSHQTPSMVYNILCLSLYVFVGMSACLPVFLYAYVCLNV